MKGLVTPTVVGAVGIACLSLLVACVSPSRRPLPANNPFQRTTSVSESGLQQGIATGDVTSHSAQIWLRTQQPRHVNLTWWPQRDQQEAGVPAISSEANQQSLQVHTTAEQDFTSILPLSGLEPGTSYTYKVQVLSPGGGAVSNHTKMGTFSTWPDPEVRAPFHFIWSGDLGGQGHCRTSDQGYRIFDIARATKPSFAILLGDLVYADDHCPSPPNIPGSDFIADNLADYRAKHRYQREDPALQRFLATIPIYAVWDDHEVVNNFSGIQEPLMPIGRQAFREYWPLEKQEGAPHRMYRKVRYGADVEIFVLDTRQYRSMNSEQDGPHKSMLGQQQLSWLVEGLRQSSATWKFIVTSVPLSIQKEGFGSQIGNDSWARGISGTGFYHELQFIVSHILQHQISNVLWLSGDVHIAQANAYDPNQDGVIDFHECIAGPLSAGTRTASMPLPDLHPITLFSGGGFMNFGVIRGDHQRLTVQFIDETGVVRFEHTIAATSS